ncbi:MAG: phage integrase SAM-like domain-containing protein [Terriglobia bacterium]
MNTGIQIAFEFPQTSFPPPISSERSTGTPEGPPEPPQLSRATLGTLRTLDELLRALSSTEPVQADPVAMLKSTVGHLSRYLGRAPDKISIESLADASVLDGFVTYLKEKGRGKRGLSRNSVRSYVNYVRVLLRKARSLGWTAKHAEAEGEWKEIFHRAKKHGCSAVVQYAICNGLKPESFQDAHMEEMGQTMIRKGYTYKHVLTLKRNFRKLLAECGFQADVPGVSPFSPKPRYGIRLSDFRGPLGQEVLELLKWKTDRFAEGRPAKARIRRASAESLQELFCEVYGFARNVQGTDPTTLADLLSKDVLGKFLEWRITVREVKIRSILASLSMVSHIVKTYPPLSEEGLQWIPQMVSQLWDEVEDPDDKAKARKWVPYDELSRIPDQIKRRIESLGSGEARKKAMLFRDLLLVAWLLIQPWRQKNLRQCRLGDPMNGANLFKAEIFPLSTIARPEWVVEELKKNPKAEVRQIRFRRDETKADHLVEAILPKQLEPLLQEYLEVHRPLLVRNGDPGTLFLNDQGRPYCKYTICERVKNITLQYAGRAVNPHLFRDIVAIKWLEEHPEDYLTVSKLLWHSDIRTTLRIYGKRFDESHANRRMEQWLDERRLGSS